MQAGKDLFQANCARCHSLTSRLVGPALEGVQSRWKGDTMDIYKWIHNSQGYLSATGDPYATALYQEYKVEMPPFQSLSNGDISSILAYIKSAPTKPVTPTVGGNPVSVKKPNTTVYWVLIFALLIIALILMRTARYLHVLVRQKYEEPEGERTPVWKRKNFRPFIFFIALFLFCWLCVAMWNSASALGRQQDYAPQQPIAFSHKIHAGAPDEIDCRYCHVGAERGRTAVIPSLNVCMNCHYMIHSFSGDESHPAAQYTAEIQKIYYYTGFDPDKMAYTNPPHPIEWVKVHNLPDLVYFNHSQHVKVEGLQCQTCHGPVQDMDVIKQQENLSMGWCVNCHRNSEIHFTENEFYKSYATLQQKVADGEVKEVHASDVGATDCQKCHY